MMIPAVSVIMPVYNAEPYLKEAIESILNQTFTDFELLIIDDASTDKSVEIVKSYHDNRIVLLHKPVNSGITDSLNMAIPLAKGKYIARMDADDISMPDRFLKQYNYMEQHPDILVLGTMYKIIGTEIIPENLPITYEQVKLFSLMQSPVAHPTVFIRRSIFDMYNLRYDRTFEHTEDYELWTRIIDIGKVENLPEVLLHYRIHEQQVSTIGRKKQTETANRIRLRQLDRLMNFKNATYDSDFSIKILTRQLWNITSEDLIKVDALLKDIWVANKVKNLYNNELLFQLLKSLWDHYIFSLNKYKRSHLVKILSDPFKIKSNGLLFNIRFVVKSLLAWETKMK
ncbi:MAG: glycosyltransferase family 2 protein [Bacteroidia bacterium]